MLGATGDGKKRQASKAKEAVKQVEAVAAKLLESKGSDTSAGVAACMRVMGVMGERGWGLDAVACVAQKEEVAQLRTELTVNC